jgi:hypothetical protein
MLDTGDIAHRCDTGWSSRKHETLLTSRKNLIPDTNDIPQT